MRVFKTAREAKEYLVGRITDEAALEGAPLTEAERKMLYFSERDWTLPDMMEVNSEFERDYNQDEYEEKIGRLVRKIQERQNSGAEQQREEWCSALERLGGEDDYLLTLVDSGCRVGGKNPTWWGRLGAWLPNLNAPLPRRSGDRIRLVLSAFAVILGIGLVRALLTWLFGSN
jgi:hypothetical protein